MKHPQFFLIPVLSLVLFACQPEQKIIIVPDNTAPPDYSVPQAVKENYINKLYITLLGRKPTSVEFAAGIDILDTDNASEENRETLMDIILNDPDYYRRMYDIARVEILNNLDTTEITFQIAVFTDLLDEPIYEPFYEYIIFEINRLKDLKAVPALLTSGQIGRVEMHRRFVNNSFYDEINMGTQNFVLSLFEYFLNRYPSDAEEAACIAMVDGADVIVFGQEGHDKQDFMDIFFESDNYYEGQVIDIYQDFLFRSPNSLEMSTATIAYKTDSDYKKLLKTILTTDEFLGI
ncbi:MAG: hypothetical protein SF052_22190 [Bacteroidia bacterium]|nr:hypothetical protein [Bacteroidia bacterium]